jgi:fumarate hydratase class II
VGTGINAPAGFAQATIELINHHCDTQFTEASNHFEAQGGKDTCVELSGVLKTVAVSLYKIANDIRWLGSGPRCGIGEIRIPAVQPGSSIMPGKVNPVIAESVMQVAAQIIGNDSAIAIGGLSGNFELNVMMPVITHNLLQSIALCTQVSGIFAHRCIEGITANASQCESAIERSLALITSLSPVLGYDKAAGLAKKAYESGKTIREICLEEAVLSQQELSRLLNPQEMT